VIVLALLRKYWLHLVIAGLLGAAAHGIYNHGKSVERAVWQIKWSDRDTADARAQAEAERSARTEEQRRAEAMAGVQRDATQAIEKLRGDADSANAATGRLRDELAKLQARLGGTGNGAGTAISSASATRAAMVLSDLYGSCQTRLNELSQAFDRGRVAALACEASFDGLKSRAGK
jgi:predicted RNase H-like nuclease (RuvC/YqgF family)